MVVCPRLPRMVIGRQLRALNPHGEASRDPSCTSGINVREWSGVKGSEFLRRVQRLFRRNGWTCEWRADRGKGSHGLLLLRGRRTVVPNLKSELKTGLYRGLLRNLEITEAELLDE